MPGSIAARTMAWQRRMSGVAGPFSASGEASNGNPVQVELLIDGVWTDITAYVMVRDDNGSISITRGMRDEGSQTDHATLQLTLNNRDGRFSPRNPVGTYYGLIGRNQPIRVSVPNGIGGKAYRFWGEVSAWPQMWDPTGTDVWVELEASGILRRLSQGPPREKSPIYDAILRPQISGLRAYWPCEDAAEATQIESALVTGSPMVFLGEAPELAKSEIFGGSYALPTFTNAAMRGSVAKYDSPSATQVRFLLYIPPEGTSDLNLIVRVEQVEDNTVSNHSVYEVYYNAPNGAGIGVVNPGSLSMNFRDLEGLTFGSALHHNVDLRGKMVRFSLEFEESGSSTNYTIRTLDLVSGAEIAVTQNRTTHQLTRVTSVLPYVTAGTSDTATGFPSGVMGHITVQDVVTDIEDLGVRLDPAGETAGRRVQRLCAEEGLAFDGVGDLDSTVTMGGQGQLNPLSLMQECELADTGMLHENLAVLGLVYRTRRSLENQDPQVTLNYAAFNLAEVPLPVEDDRYVQNKITVTVKEVSATYALDDSSVLSISQPPTGVGVYGTDLTLNLFDPDDAGDHAAWRVHLGTVDEARHPSISVNLAHPSFTSDPLLKQAVLALRQGDRIQVTNPPAWLPSDAIDQIILGFEETVSNFEHKITFTCAPASPYTVGVLDSVLGRIDTDGSELLTAVSSGATSLDVVPSLGQSGLWTTDSAEVPWNIRMGGEVMTVTACNSVLDDPFSRSVSNSWGTADVTGQTWSTVGGGAASDYSVGSGYGVHVLSTVDVTRRTSITAVSADCDFYGSVTTSALASGASLFGALTARMQDSGNMYQARVEFTTSNTVLLVVRKLIADVGTDLGSYTVPVTHVAGTFIRVRFKLAGSSLKAKGWLASELEPDVWNISVNDTALSQGYTWGTRSIRTTGNTNAASVEIRYDNFKVVNPQTFTVTRSVNGTVKAHAAGSDIRLATPLILSL